MIDESQNASPADVRMRGFARRETLEDATDWLDSHLRPLAAETVPILEAAGRVLATDISNAALNQQRQARFAKLLQQNDAAASNDDALRTTVMLELLMRAAYVAHVMQPWPQYQQQNQHRFQESMAAFYAKRVNVNPANFWYKSE